MHGSCNQELGSCIQVHGSCVQELGPRLTWLRVVQEAAVAEVVRRLQQGGVGGAEAQGRGQGGHQRSLPRPHVTLCHAAVTMCH